MIKIERQAQVAKLLKGKTIAAVVGYVYDDEPDRGREYAITEHTYPVPARAPIGRYAFHFGSRYRGAGGAAWVVRRTIDCVGTGSRGRGSVEASC